jgi:formamidopyrimidine-DNA glycosylase
MPELPEVEVTRQSFAAAIEGATVQEVRLGAPLRWPLGVAPQSLRGARVGATVRRGKYLWLPLQQHVHADAGLLLHLGMSGSLAFGSAGALPPAGKHDHFEMHTSKGLLRLTDPRRFGAVVWSASMHVPPASKLLARLGAEPFDAALSALFSACIDPRTRCNRISLPRAARLLQAVRDTLGQALALGGSTLRDFRDAHGMSGNYQEHARVYGREGQPCVRCAGVVRRVVQSQRASYFCPGCQKR